MSDGFWEALTLGGINDCWGCLRRGPTTGGAAGGRLGVDGELHVGDDRDTCCGAWLLYFCGLYLQ